jgi:N-acetylglucosamine kinase-like BadF-type ATPase
MNLSAQSIALLFRVVQQQASAGDAVARRLCRDAAGHLAELATTILSRLGWRRRPVPVVCSGGIFRSSALIRRSFTQRVHEYAPKAKVTLLRHEPVEGALILARQLIRPQSSKAR